MTNESFKDGLKESKGGQDAELTYCFKKQTKMYSLELYSLLKKSFIQTLEASYICQLNIQTYLCTEHVLKCSSMLTY